MRAKSGRLPPLSRESLALKLRKNWDDRHPTDAACLTSGLDDSLTSLSWLQNLSIMKIAAPQPAASPAGQPRRPNADDGDDGAAVVQFSSNDQVDPNAVLNMTNVSGGVRVKQEPGLVQLRALAGLDVGSTSNIDGLEGVDYKTNGHVKPPYSYATLICMAMRDSQKKKITLAGIYNWITENFMYYRMADPSWQNSIRHNLSLNKCFQKVPRRKDEPGKGGFWRINPEYEDMFVNGIFKKRRCSPIVPTTPVRGEPTGANTPVGDVPTATPPPLKKIKRENEDSNSSMSSLSGLAMAGAMPPLLTPMNSIDETENAVRSIEIKREPNLNSSAVYVKTGSGNDVEDDAMDISWSTILNQDIEVAGVKVKTEDIIDTPDGAASPITALSPPASDTDNSEISLDDLLKADFSSDVDNPLDLTNGSTLDLTISGIGLKAPEWWEESLNGSRPLFVSPSGHSRMSTPVAAIDDSDFAHPWAEDKSNSDGAADSFDGEFSSLFQLMDNMPSPKMPTES